MKSTSSLFTEQFNPLLQTSFHVTLMWPFGLALKSKALRCKIFFSTGDGDWVFSIFHQPVNSTSLSRKGRCSG